MKPNDDKDVLRAAKYIHSKLGKMSEETLSAAYLRAIIKNKNIEFSLNGNNVQAQDIESVALPIVLWHAWGVHCYICEKPRVDLIDHTASQIRLVYPPLSRSDLFLYMTEAVHDMNEALGHNNIIELAPLHNQIMAIKSANKTKSPAPGPN